MLASCAKNETIDNSGTNGKGDLNRISFQTTTGTATRGAVADLTTLQGISGGFEVIGIANYGNTSGTAAPLFGSNSNKYAYTSATDKWDWVYGDDKDWPSSTKFPLRFIAANPLPSGLAWNSTKATFTPADDVSAQVDQLATMVPVIVTPANNTVPMKFNHILSAVQFKMKSSVGYKVNIKEVKIVNVLGSREYDFATATWALQSSTLPTWQTKTYNYFTSTAASSLQALTFADANALPIVSGNFADVAISDKGQLMPVPQEGKAITHAEFLSAANAWVNAGSDLNVWPTADVTTALKTGAYLQMTYNMIDDLGAYVIGKANNYVRVLFPLDLMSGTNTQWDPSKRYTYTLIVGTPDSSNGILMDPEYKDENNGSTGDAVDNPKVNPGEPVTKKGKITFKVTVEDWTDQAGVDIK